MKRRAAGLGVLAGLLLMAGTTVADAGFDNTATASGSLSTATLAPPTGLGAVAGACVALVSDAITLTWVASPSTWADGYAIYRATSTPVPTAAPAVPIATVGAATLVYADTPLSFSTTYYYAVVATKLAWRSVASAEASRTTRSSLCV